MFDYELQLELQQMEDDERALLPQQVGSQGFTRRHREVFHIRLMNDYFGQNG
ncbi:unnamed protein product [Linum tenue]|uniref:Uncharacterized protein n=1 Tax=Linum tenue TaxID=586396 RepID=A0AAV0J245_9ROSI|nr:unnamed protein product [Linum tenue]